jgi:WD40 repeat protein
MHLAKNGRALLIHKNTARVLDLDELTWLPPGPFKDCNWGFLSPDGKQAVLGSGFAVRLVDVGSGTKLFDFDGSWAALEIGAFSSDGQRFATAASNSALVVWDLPGRKKQRELRNLPRRCNGLAFCLDDRCLLSCDDGALHLWDIELERERHHLDRRSSFRDHLFSPDRSLYLLWQGSPFVEVFDLRKWTSTARFRTPGGGAQFSADGRRVLCSSATEVSLWDVARQEKVCDLRPFRLVDTGNITSVALSPDSRRILTGHRTGNVWLWDVASEKPTRLAQFDSPLWSVAFIDDDRALLWCNDNTVRVWGLPR